MRGIQHFIYNILVLDIFVLAENSKRSYIISIFFSVWQKISRGFLPIGKKYRDNEENVPKGDMTSIRNRLLICLI
jgi:hypothetical protein